MTKIDLLLKITAPIICKEGRKRLGTASGFFYHHDGKVHLVTNRHVFIDEEKNFYPDKVTISLNRAGDKLTESGELSYPLYHGPEGEKRWIEIAPEVDIAALEIDKPKGYIFAALGKENLPPDDLEMSLGEQVLVIGYPRGFYDEVHNLPIVKNAIIASAYDVPFRRKPIFLVDSHLQMGTSGSPVITVPRNFRSTGGSLQIGPLQWHFLGVHSGTFGDLQLNAVWYSRLIPQMLEKHYAPKDKTASTKSKSKDKDE